MATAHVIYHFDEPGWWAESPDYPEYSAFGDSLDEVRALVLDGLRFTAEDDTLQVIDLLPALVAATYSAPVDRKLEVFGLPTFARYRELAATG